jgi:uncharacterized surface protein with fasciclin (FAS1) repeats
MAFKKNIFKNTLGALSAAALCFAGVATQSCSDDIDQSNRYTFTGETVIDYLENRSDQFSDFITILNRATIGRESAGSVKHLLSTYGNYTCFAPTNAAVQRHLFEQDSIYWEEVKKLEADPEYIKDFRDTGIHSPYLEDLSDSMCCEIAKNHILEEGYLTVDLAEGAFPTPNLNDRYITLYWVADTITGAVSIKLNDSSFILDSDNEVENGIVQVIDRVLSPSTALLPDLLKSYEEVFGIFAEAIEKTEIDSRMTETKRDIPGTNPACSWNYGDHFNREWQASGAAPALVPESHYVKFTFLAVPDKVLKEKYGIDSFDALKEFANKWYGDTYHEGTPDYDDYTSPNNPVYRLLAYHIVDRQLQYSAGFVHDNVKLSATSYNSDNQNGFKQGFDLCEYYETFLGNGKLMKFTKPATSSDPDLVSQIVVNYAQDKGARFRNPEMRNHMNVRVYSVADFKATIDSTFDFKQEAINGIIHPIDKLIIYNDNEMKGNILNERIRMNFMSWFPELTNNNIRWVNNKLTKTEHHMIPDGYCERIKFNSAESHMYYLCPHYGYTNSWSDFQGDEIITAGMYDFEYRIPHVPAGTYELRLGTCLCATRGVAQTYIDGKVTGIPVDLRTEAASKLVAERFAFVTDSKLGDPEAIDEDDKARRNRGWMKGPASAFVGDGTTPLRDAETAARLILGTFNLSEGDHWVRFKNVMEGDNTVAEFMHNYFEIVPRGIIMDPANPEDKN